MDLSERIAEAFDKNATTEDLEWYEERVAEDYFERGFRAALPRWIPVGEAEDMHSYLIDGDDRTAYLYSAFDEVFTGGGDEIPSDQITWILDIAKLPQLPEDDL